MVVKKIKKYAKFMVCMALITGLVAPSYAALSASDGSAFVTKAEFDSALADFNARLTTFEAGINSKIDSQVTSYLDRNGIWNGMNQTVKLSNKWNGYYFVKFDSIFEVRTTEEEGYLTAQSVRHIEPGVPTVDAGSTVEPTNVINHFSTNLHRVAGVNPDGYNVVVIENVSKSGLCLIEYDVIDSYDIDNSTGARQSNNRLQWELPISPKVWNAVMHDMFVGAWGSHDYWVLSCSRQVGTITGTGDFVPKTSRECFFEDFPSAFAKGFSLFNWVKDFSAYSVVGTNVGNKAQGNGSELRSTGYVTHNRSGRMQDFVFVSKGDKLVFHYEPSYHVTPYGNASPYFRSGFHTGDVDCVKPLRASVY